MRWLIIAFLSMCNVFTVFSNIFTLSQHTVSSDLIELLRLNNCQLPCWIGIIPGETTVGEARLIIANSYNIPALFLLEPQTSLRFLVTHIASNYKLRITLSAYDEDLTDSSVIRHIGLNPYVGTDSAITRPSLSEILTLLGEPDLVRLSSGVENYSVSLVYTDILVYVGIEDLECDKVLSNQEVLGIGIAAEALRENLWPAEAQIWRGYDICYNFERRPTY